MTACLIYCLAIIASLPAVFSFCRQKESHFWVLIDHFWGSHSPILSFPSCRQTLFSNNTQQSPKGPMGHSSIKSMPGSCRQHCLTGTSLLQHSCRHQINHWLLPAELSQGHLPLCDIHTYIQPHNFQSLFSIKFG